MPNGKRCWKKRQRAIEYLLLIEGLYRGMRDGKEVPLRLA